MTAQERNTQALFEAWYELEMPRIFRYVCYRVRDRAAAEEVTAAVCVEAIQHLDRYDPCRGEFEGWMFGIARNVVVMYLRSRARDPQTMPLDSLPDIVGPDRTPEQIYERKELFLDAVLCLSSLTEQEQEVIALRYGAELSSRMIGQAMGISEGHVRVLLHRALKSMRSAMRARERT